jgi:hypothetical protein
MPLEGFKVITVKQETYELLKKIATKHGCSIPKAVQKSAKYFWEHGS